MAFPNLVFILVDDLGYGDIGAFNGGISRTPSINALCAESVRCSQHYAASPVCNPSRAALLTGRYPHRTGSIDTLEWRGLERLALRERTLADILGAAGYATGLVGKWHLGAFDGRYHPSRRGFDETVCFCGGMHDYYGWRLQWDGRVGRADGRYLTDVFTDEAVSFIARHEGEPFFLHLTYNAPHTPLQAPASDLELFVDREDLNPSLRTLYAMIHRLDAGVGRVLEALERRGLTENTLVVFCSDNGPQFGMADGFSLDRFNCGLRGAKGTVFEGGVRVPALLRWPAGLGGGRDHHGLVHSCDWLPTLCRALGVPVPDGLPLDGVDLWPQIGGAAAKAAAPRFWQWNRYAPLACCNAAMRDGDWKLVYPSIPEAMVVHDLEWLAVSMYQPEYFEERGLVTEIPERSVAAASAPLLFNLREDPLEQSDLAEAQPDRVLRMSRAIETWFEEVERERVAITDDEAPSLPRQAAAARAGRMP
jgi:arylsulfatase A-like enzyme